MNEVIGWWMVKNKTKLINEWLNGWIGMLTDTEWVLKWNNGCHCKYERMVGRMKEWIKEWMNERMNERMKEWMNEMKDEWMNEWVGSGRGWMVDPNTRL